MADTPDPRAVDLYGTAYSNFYQDALRQVRLETYGEDFGQSSWVTADEYRRYFALMKLTAQDEVLDLGCGSGGPALFLAREVGCRVTGLDFNEAGIGAGRGLVREAGLDTVDLRACDITQRLPLPDASFTAAVCMDAMCHLADRGRLLADWHRVLRPGGRLLYTDPVVVTGFVSREELATRSSTGYFEFGPTGANERAIAAAGFELAHVEDVTENEAVVSKCWYDARERRASELIPLEGEETFAGLQRFLATVHQLTAGRRLSRFVYLCVKR